MTYEQRLARLEAQLESQAPELRNRPLSRDEVRALMLRINPELMAKINPAWVAAYQQRSRPPGHSGRIKTRAEARSFILGRTQGASEKSNAHRQVESGRLEGRFIIAAHAKPYRAA